MTDPIHGWSEKLNLACVNNYKIGLIGGSYFIGWVLTLLIVGRLADIYGRKWIYRVNMVITLFLFGAIYLASNVDQMILINFGIGLTTTGRLSVGFLYMMEFVQMKH